MVEFDAAVVLSPFETEWTLRGRLLVASLATQLAVLEADGASRLALYQYAGVRCAQVEQIATDALDCIGNALREAGVNLDELMAEGWGARSDLLAEEYGIKTDE